MSSQLKHPSMACARDVEYCAIGADGVNNLHAHMLMFESQSPGVIQASLGLEESVKRGLVLKEEEEEKQLSLIFS